MSIEAMRTVRRSYFDIKTFRRSSLIALLYCSRAKSWRWDTSVVLLPGKPIGCDGTTDISNAPMEITACRIDPSDSETWSMIRFQRTGSRYPLRWGAVLVVKSWKKWYSSWFWKREEHGSGNMVDRLCSADGRRGLYDGCSLRGFLGVVEGRETGT